MPVQKISNFVGNNFKNYKEAIPKGLFHIKNHNTSIFLMLPQILKKFVNP